MNRTIFVIILLLVISCGYANAQVSTQPTISARMVPSFSANNDSLYLDIEVKRALLTDALGNADFAFRITDARTNVPGIGSPIDLNGFTLIKRGKWDAGLDTNFIRMSLNKTANGSTYVLCVRTKTPFNLFNASRYIMPSAFGSAGFVARIATRIYAGACLDSIRLEWSRNTISSIPSGYMTGFRFLTSRNLVNNEYIPLTENNYIKLKPEILPPLVGVTSLPLAVLFTWYNTPNAKRYYARIVKGSPRETTYVNIGNANITEYRVQTIPLDTVFFTLFTKTSCSLDSAKSEIAYAPALECPTLTLLASSISTNNPNAYCPTETITVTVDTVGKNLAKPVSFSFDGGTTYTFSNSQSFVSPKDTTIRVTYKDGNRCLANAIIPFTILVQRLTNRQSSVSFNLAPTTLCNNERTQLQYSKVGDNLDYEWRTSGSGTFYDGNGTAVTTPTINPIYYQASPSDTGKVIFTIISPCFGLQARDTINYIPAPIATIEIDPTQFVNGNLPSNTPIRFTNSSSKPGETYDYNFNDGNPAINNTTETTITRTFQSGGDLNLLLTSKSKNGCTDTSLVRFKVSENYEAFVPNIFSPLANTPADQNLRINGIGIQESITFKIFDTWGKEVYSTTSYSVAKNEGWNGKKNNNGKDLQSGNYTYVLQGKFLNNKTFEKTGGLTLVR